MSSAWGNPAGFLFLIALPRLLTPSWRHLSPGSRQLVFGLLFTSIGAAGGPLPCKSGHFSSALNSPTASHLRVKSDYVIEVTPPPTARDLLFGILSTPLPLAGSAPSTLAPLLVSEQFRSAPTLGPLPLLFSLPEILFLLFITSIWSTVTLNQRGHPWPPM